MATMTPQSDADDAGPIAPPFAPLPAQAAAGAAADHDETDTEDEEDDATPRPVRRRVVLPLANNPLSPKIPAAAPWTLASGSGEEEADGSSGQTGPDAGPTGPNAGNWQAGPVVRGGLARPSGGAGQSGPNAGRVQAGNAVRGVQAGPSNRAGAASGATKPPAAPSSSAGFRGGIKKMLLNQWTGRNTSTTTEHQDAMDRLNAPEDVPVKRKRGRPPGSKNKKPRVARPGQPGATSMLARLPPPFARSPIMRPPPPPSAETPVAQAGSSSKVRRYPKLLAFDRAGVPHAARMTPNFDFPSRSLEHRLPVDPMRPMTDMELERLRERRGKRGRVTSVQRGQPARVEDVAAGELARLTANATAKYHMKMNLRGRNKLHLWLSSGDELVRESVRFVAEKLDIDMRVCDPSELPRKLALGSMKNNKLRSLEALQARLRTSNEGRNNWWRIVNAIRLQRQRGFQPVERPLILPPRRPPQSAAGAHSLQIPTAQQAAQEQAVQRQPQQQQPQQQAQAGPLFSVQRAQQAAQAQAQAQSQARQAQAQPQGQPQPQRRPVLQPQPPPQQQAQQQAAQVVQPQPPKHPSLRD